MPKLKALVPIKVDGAWLDVGDDVDPKRVKDDIERLITNKQVGYEADLEEIRAKMNTTKSYEDPNEAKAREEEEARKAAEAEKKKKPKDK